MSKVKASLFGLAFGDALGAPTEFMSYDAIVDRYGPRGPRDLPPRARVTDDTQMTLAVGDALVLARAGAPLSAERLEPHLNRLFVEWSRSPDNDRIVMWLGPPPMGPGTKTHGMDRISFAAWTEAKSRPWVDYVDTWPFFSNGDLQFVHSLPNADGQVRGMRQKDDIHLSTVGGDRLSWVVMADLGTHIDLSATKVPTPPASQVAPPGVKERDEIPESVPGAI